MTFQNTYKIHIYNEVLNISIPKIHFLVIVTNTIPLGYKLSDDNV